MDEIHSSAPALQRPGSRLGRLGLRWLYGLVALPVMTDMVETGALPGSPREWVTEVVAGLVIAALVRQVRREHSNVLALARTDGLTGLWNRRAFEEAMEEECARARRSHQPLSLIYIDIDNFKKVNDRDGHAQGDRALRQMAAAIGHALRARVDRGFRVGGDEFALLLTGSSAAQAEVVVTRIGEHCARSDPRWRGEPLGISAGIVELRPQEAASEFVHRADEAMYLKKRSSTA
jgi:diguanylate cyclase (GGDEF)-like protein